ncbi:MAG: DUF6051 family protein [Bacteroidales bacterium]
MKDFICRHNYLKTLFENDKSIRIADRSIQIDHFPFKETTPKAEMRTLARLVPQGTDFCADPDNLIQENKAFNYPLFYPLGKEKHDRCILLLHGLNERNWDKYLSWAEYLCDSTGTPVLLFPIAFHMNRTPQSWIAPRNNMPWVNFRKTLHPELNNSTFANVALSLRLSASPLRMYTSGRETILNLCQLIRQIREGKHPLFKAGCKVDLFAYSIGALLAQICMLGNPKQLLTDSKVFLFCGGSIFDKMNGSAREILDQAAWDQVHNYYASYWGSEQGLNDSVIPDLRKEPLNKAFISMLRQDILPEFRRSFFAENKERLQIVTLKKDTVIPTPGVWEALGDKESPIACELDFPFQYTHQNPFPAENRKIDTNDLNTAFDTVFTRAANFLA